MSLRKPIVRLHLARQIRCASHGTLAMPTAWDLNPYVAGLRVQDVVLQVDGVIIRNENHLINLISTFSPGQRVRLQVWRNREMVALDAVVGDWSKAQPRFQQP